MPRRSSERIRLVPSLSDPVSDRASLKSDGIPRPRSIAEVNLSVRAYIHTIQRARTLARGIINDSISIGCTLAVQLNAEITSSHVNDVVFEKCPQTTRRLL